MNKKVIKICIFDSHSTPSDVRGGNGDAILDNICIECKTDEHLISGENYLEATFLVDEEGLWKNIQQESILKVEIDYGEEYYRISQIKSTSSDIQVFARQETIHQTLHMWLSDVRPENQTGQGALSWIKDYSSGPKNITVLSDISKISTAYYMDMNMYQALHDCEQSFANRWGGEIQRRGYTLRINTKIGTHRGVQIRSNKNLTGFEADTNIDNVFTRLKPKGYNGITLNDNEFVDSPLINTYQFIKTTDPKYDDVKVKDENNDEGYDTLEQAQAELIRRAQLEFSKNNIDKIKADYIVNFLQLEQTEEYKDYIVAERIYIGDEIDVYEEKLDINITVRAIRRSYDVLRQRVIEIELSNEVVRKEPPTLGDLITKVEGIEEGLGDNFENIFNQAKEDATDIINAGIKDSYVVVRKNEVLIMDTTDINTATNVWRWNRGGLGFSSTGYYGQYGTAITNDGKIVADFITTGVLNAGLIKTGVLRNHNNDFELNLDDGTVKINNNNFKVIVDGKEEGVVGQSQMTQTIDGWEYKINKSQNNLVLNSTGKSKSNASPWEVYRYNQGASTYVRSLNSYWTGDRDAIEVFTSDTGSVDTGARQGIEVIAGRVHTLVCYIAGHRCDKQILVTNSADNQVLAASSVYGHIQGATEHWEKVVLKFTPTENKAYIRLGMVNTWIDGSANSKHLWCRDLCVVEGNFPDIEWRPALGEVMNDITNISGDGVTVSHENSSFSRMNSQEFFQANENGERTYSVRYGGTRYYKWEHNKGYIGSLSATRQSNLDAYGLTLFGTDDSHYIDIGFAESYVGDGQAQNIQSWLRCDRWNHWITTYKPFSNTVKFRSGIRALRSDGVDSWGGLSYMANGSYRYVHAGDQELALGCITSMTDTSWTSEAYLVLKRLEDIKIHSYHHWDFHNWTMYNMRTVSSLSAQSTYLRARTKDINEVYGVSSFTDGEIRYSDRKEYCTFEDILEYVDINGEKVQNENYGRYTEMIEIPQILAENIELDYHVNISKLSWGDYRIIEKDTYYFIIESEKPNFRFTFEIVAKKIESPNAFVRVANLQYETEFGTDDTDISNDFELHSKYAAMSDEQIEEELDKEQIELLKENNELWKLYSKVL